MASKSPSKSPQDTNKPHLPVTRIKTIMQSSSDADKISAESAKIMTKAAELFIKELAQEAQKLTNKNNLDYKHIANIVHNNEKYEFLREMIPKKITYAKYKEIMRKRQDENKFEFD